MKNDIAVIYSSRTGNTQKVAERLAEALGASCHSVKDTAAVPENADLCIGTWIDRGTADASAKKYIESLRGRRVFIYGTLGAEPDSEHCAKGIANIRALFDPSNLVQGAIDPMLIEMFKSMPKDNVHAFTEENAARYAAAASHPDEGDFAQVIAAAKEALA